MQHRAADEQADIGPLAMNPEILLVGAILFHRIEAGGVDGQASLGVEYLDRPEMPRGRGMIEQDQVPDRL
jgi:hypothetical protein